ncbi:HET-domain-containing protein [Byssothecium circinans]|uniref:HET-domain-containing protein n=1 Tax=Byssothecium circinans TaxID=147558 RepID=A0A6A5U7I7_9PLEO|nr:HET-domain-containing protein [Byssothecium circinans]
MRLLRFEDNGEFSLVEFVGKNIPPYAILSHTWGADHEEVTFKDIKKGTGKSKAGYSKIRFCGKQADNDGLQFFWVDTCCIDKSSSAELSEAINSMFQWYYKADKCYVYLSDVSCSTSVESDRRSPHTWKPFFRGSRWFTRGWTLQELLAPRFVDFFSADGERLGDRNSLLQDIHDITMIPLQALQRYCLSQFSIDERLSWVESRQTKREEDMVYSLLGIFDVHMPLIYGEGRKKALVRLQKEIRERTYDERSGMCPETRNEDQHDAHTRNCIAIPASEFSFTHATKIDPLRTRSNFREFVRASGYPDSVPYDRAFKNNPIYPAGDQIIRVQLVDSVCIRGKATNIPEGRYDVKWIFCFPELGYVQLLPDDCPTWHRILAALSINDRASHNFHLWLNNKLNPIFCSSNLSLSVGQTSSDDFMQQAVDGTKYTSPIDKLLKPGYQERKLSPLMIDGHRNTGWCELDSDEIFQVTKEGQLAFVIWRKHEPLWLPGFAFGGVRLQPRG